MTEPATAVGKPESPDLAARAAKAIPKSEWKWRRRAVFGVLALCAALLLGCLWHAVARGGNPTIDRLIDGTFTLLGLVMFYYVFAPVADDAVDKFARYKSIARAP